MIKYFCNKCQKELSKSDRYRCELKIRGFSAVTDSFDCDYCEQCISKIVGIENFNEIKSREAERKKRIAERKQERLTAHPTEKGGE